MVKLDFVPPIPVDRHIQLTMSMDVAEVLYSILRRVGGEPRGLRGKADQVHNALRDAGVKSLSDDVEGSLRWKK